VIKKLAVIVVILLAALFLFQAPDQAGTLVRDALEGVWDLVTAVGERLAAFFRSLTA
jgi:hypothetical protein